MHFLLQLTPLHQRTTLQPHDALAEAYCGAMHIRPVCYLKPESHLMLKELTDLMDLKDLHAQSKHKTLTTWSSA